jgi:hypothetical protein
MPARWGSALVFAFAVCAFCFGPGSAASAQDPFATRLAAKDPGALLGGSTVVVDDTGADVYAAHGRRSYVAVLGAGAVVFGSPGVEELGARAPRVTLRGRSGRDVLHGGRDGTLIGGPGPDLMTATQGGATVRAGSGDYVVLRGRGDRVVCLAGARGLVIRRSAGTIVDPACRRRGARVRTDDARPSSTPARARAAQVGGNGSNDNPFVAPCDSFEGGDFCTVGSFPRRSLSGAWANEFVPAYKCPDSYPWVRNKTYAPPFTSWGSGVEVQEDQSDFAIGVSITGQSLRDTPYPNDMMNGTLTGFPNSSASNWLWGGDHWYKVILHCTSDACRSTDKVGPPKGCTRGAGPSAELRRALSDQGK